MYQEKAREEATHSTEAVTLPQVTHCQRACWRLGP